VSANLIPDRSDFRRAGRREPASSAPSVKPRSCRSHQRTDLGSVESVVSPTTATDLTSFVTMFDSLVDAVISRAAASGFTASCDEQVGRLLSVLAAAVPPEGRILELGTGAGVGTGWLAARAATSVHLHTIELDGDRSAETRAAVSWPTNVTFHVGDAVEVTRSLGVAFDLIFADAPGGKWSGLDETLAALRPGGLLVVDDMTPAQWESAIHQRMTEAVRIHLLGDPGLVSVELPFGTGVILSTRVYGAA
jgi:predicted O-methyltransferase YrrM